jgi:hypothetical protein
MPFWPVVLAALLGVPFLLVLTGMGTIFAAAGLGNGGQVARANLVIGAWLVFAGVLVALFGAFGLVPAWRAWHGGGEHFGDGLRRFVDWLVGVGIAGLLGAVALRAYATVDRARFGRSPLVKALAWLLLALGMVPWAALAAWVAWPLVLWPVRGRFDWPDPATGWTRTGAIALVLIAAMAVEVVRHKRRERRDRAAAPRE